MITKERCKRIGGVIADTWINLTSVKRGKGYVSNKLRKSASSVRNDASNRPKTLLNDEGGNFIEFCISSLRLKHVQLLLNIAKIPINNLQFQIKKIFFH